METHRGTITRLMTRKRYGFIRKDDGTDVFFHEQGVISPSFNELKEGMPVEFLVTGGDSKGTRAIGVVAA